MNTGGLHQPGQPLQALAGDRSPYFGKGINAGMILSVDIADMKPRHELLLSSTVQVCLEVR